MDWNGLTIKTMIANKSEEEYVDELASVMRRYRSIGSLRMIELVKTAYEKEIGYSTYKSRHNTKSTTRRSLSSTLSSK